MAAAELAGALRLNLVFYEPRARRVFRSRQNPLDLYKDEEIKRRYRFLPATILFVTNVIAHLICHGSTRNRALSPLQQVLSP